MQPPADESRLVRALDRYRRNRAAAASIEFAILAPLMIVMLLGAIDTARYVVASEEINDAVRVIGQMVTESTARNVNDLDLQFYHDAMMIVFPDVLADAAMKRVKWRNDIAVTISSIRFTATPGGCAASCNYVANVVWTSGDSPRPCNVALTPVADASAPSPSTLPADVYGPGSVIVVDAQYNFTAWFAPEFFRPIPIVRSIYLAPRYVSEIGYVGPGVGGVASTCP